MNYTLETSAKLQQIYEDKRAPLSVRMQCHHELKKRWKQQPRPMNLSGFPADPGYYNHEIHFMPEPTA